MISIHVVVAPHFMTQYACFSLPQVEAALSLTQVIPSRAKYAIQTAYNVVHYFLPVLLTLACYLLNIVAVSLAEALF